MSEDVGDCRAALRLIGNKDFAVADAEFTWVCLQHWRRQIDHLAFHIRGSHLHRITRVEGRAARRGRRVKRRESGVWRVLAHHIERYAHLVGDDLAQDRLRSLADFRAAAEDVGAAIFIETDKGSRAEGRLHGALEAGEAEAPILPARALP